MWDRVLNRRAFLTHAINTWIAREVIPAYPDRFRAFAALPIREPQAAADELEWAVRDDGLVGCMTYGAIGGRFLDAAAFEPVLARAEALGAPVYIHPASPSPEVMDLYYNGLGDDWVSKILAGVVVAARMEEGNGSNTGSPVGGAHTPTGTP